MRNTFLLLALCGLLVACKKERPQPAPVEKEHPEMRYSNLQDATVGQGFRKIDLNGDGVSDLHVKMQLVADNALGVTKKQFCVRAEVGSHLFINEQSETPVYSLLQLIGTPAEGFNWYEVNESVLAEKLSGATDTWWDGLWKNAQRRFLALQVHTGEKKYNGWVELSIDKTGEQVVLHRSGISLEADRAVRAGL